METKQDTTKEPKRYKFSRADSERQWELFADEYDIPNEEDTAKGLASLSMSAIREKLIQGIIRGKVAIVEDAEHGIVVKQYLQHPVQGLPSGDNPLVYVAPTVAHVSMMGWGKSNDETALQARFARVAAALTGQAEPLICKMKGGDRARMETIANLFMSA